MQIGKFDSSRNGNITFVILFILFACIYLFFAKTNNSSRYSGTGITRYNISNIWICKFKYLDGKIQGTFISKKSNSRIVYSCKTETGKVFFRLYNKNDSLLTILNNNNETDTITNIFVKGEKYRICAIASKAKGNFEFKME